jgi:GWxTD domain-containing protein
MVVQRQIRLRNDLPAWARAGATRLRETESVAVNEADMKSCPPAVCSALIVLGLLCSSSIFAQEWDSAQTDSVPAGTRPKETFARPPRCFGGQDHEEESRLAKKAYANLPALARFWLNEDAVYIISPQERCAFLRLSTDQERAQFIEAFWARRAPDPTSLDNSFELEHYERIAFADEKYGGRISGWKTDRGRIYILFGPPDSIESHRAGEKNDQPTEVGPQTFPYPAEVWHYHHLRGVEEDVGVTFLDPDGSGNYRLSLSPEGKEEPIFATSEKLPRSGGGEVNKKSSQSIVLFVGQMPTPQVQFKDLEACVSARIIRNQVPFNHRIEFSKATDATTLARISIYPAGEQPNPTGNSNASVGIFEVFGRISERSGWIVRTIEAFISLDGRKNTARAEGHFIAALAPGTYRLAIAVKNMVNGEVGTLGTPMQVPTYDELNAKK